MRGVSYSLMQDARSHAAVAGRVKTLPVTGALLLCFLLSFAACSCVDPEAALVEAEASRVAGDFEREREILRTALEASPDDVALLMAASRYYLRAEPERRYKPRLALHYAMRASQAADSPNQEVSRLLFTAYRAAGGSEGGRELAKLGLGAVGHPDAEDPRGLRPVDPDLVEPTLANLIEQRRRWDEGPTPPCPPGTGHIPAGRYPVGAGGEHEVAGFCIDVLAAGELATQQASAADIEAACRARDRRLCRVDESLVACTAMLAVFGAHPACTVDLVQRCCRAESHAPR